MKIIFNEVVMQNFLSVGDSPVSITLDSHPLTLIRGDNGCGKTTLTSSIPFALFGKTPRGVNKSQYVNSINKKNCLVTITFTIDEKDEYTIRRGIKPNIFEIYKNGTLVDQDSSVHDYQSHLEKKILRFNYQTFVQIVFLAASSYTPFMLLSAAQKREIIEELLDISIFSKMKKVLKDRISVTREAIKKSENDLQLKKQEFRHVKEINKILSSKYYEKRDEIRETISDAQSRLDDLESNVLEKLNGEIAAMEKKIRKKNHAELSETLEKFIRSHATMEQRINGSKEKIAFFQDKSVCPSCEQAINDENAKKLIERQNEIIKNTEMMLEEIISVESSVRESLNEIEMMEKEHTSLINEKKTAMADARQCKKVISDAQQEFIRIESEMERKKNNKENNQDESEIANEIVDISERKDDEKRQLEYYSLIDSFLKDKDGIKSFMISSYIPKINQILNEYLQMFDFFVSFTFDENFNETIKSRHRDTFTYSSFSAGQQARIDLSILFVWREIAKLRNSVQTNLLCLDEVFDSSLDQVGEERLVEILQQESEINGTNVFVISHSDGIKGMDFDREIAVRKPRMFSEIEIGG